MASVFESVTNVKDSPRECAVISGTAIAKEIRAELKLEVDRIAEKYGKPPGLSVIIVGDRRDSATYVRMKKKACAEAGIHSVGIELPADIEEADLLKKVHELNDDPDVHGILVQLPLPKHISEQNVLRSIHFEKDVDGFHPSNVAELTLARPHTKETWAAFTGSFSIPCTPQGCIELLDRSGVEISGKNAVVLGRSQIVGVPVQQLLLQRNATVTTCHSRTKNIQEEVRRADIIVAAVGRAQMVKGSWIKPGAVIIDVGINSIDDASKKSGYRLVGDVDYEEAKQVAGACTPVPGGVGPMTIAMLLKNTVNASKRAMAQTSAKE